MFCTTFSHRRIDNVTVVLEDASDVDPKDIRFLLVGDDFYGFEIRDLRLPGKTLLYNPTCKEVSRQSSLEVYDCKITVKVLDLEKTRKDTAYENAVVENGAIVFETQTNDPAVLLELQFARKVSVLSYSYELNKVLKTSDIETVATAQGFTHRVALDKLGLKKGSKYRITMLRRLNGKTAPHLYWYTNIYTKY